MLALGVGVGLVNGLIITKLRVNAFIATLGTALIIRASSRTTGTGPPGGVPTGFSQDIGYTRFGVIPASFFLLVIVAVVIWFMLRNTRFGYRIYAVGGSRGRVQAVGPAHAPHDHRARTSCAR